MIRHTSGLIVLAALLSPAFARSAPGTPRAAVLVGANAAAGGRSTLHYAYADADSIAEVLVTSGGFPRGQVQVLRDPAPAALLEAVRRGAASLSGKPDAVFFFYFSGHSDGGALYSSGRPVALEELRAALENAELSVRVGVIDACQGGGWTRAKGLVPDAPFEVTLPLVLSSEGSALIASSAGEESAHESDQLSGSYFTVHLAAGLRGAADENGDGLVTLTEAFEYARWRTIRDTARVSQEPQHPTYALNLRGRQDLVLTQVAASPSRLEVTQSHGPLELINLDSGLRVLELPAGSRTVQLAVPPGRYALRRMVGRRVRVREVIVPADGSAQVDEDELAYARERSTRKGGPGELASTPESRDVDVALGCAWSDDRSDEPNAFQTGDWLGFPGPPSCHLEGRVGLTDRLAWKIGTLALAYRIGSPERLEFVPYAGLLGWRIRNSTDEYQLGAGFALRRELGPFEARIGLGLSNLRQRHSVALLSSGYVGAGFRWRWLEVYPGVRMTNSCTGELFATTCVHRVFVGSTQELGLETPPIFRAWLPRSFRLDLHAAVVTARHPRSAPGEERVRIGLGAGRVF